MHQITAAVIVPPRATPRRSTHPPAMSGFDASCGTRKMEDKGYLLMASSDSFFSRAMLSAFASLPALPVLLPVSALAQLPVSPTGQTPGTEFLPSWNDTAAKKAIFNFVGRLTKQRLRRFRPPAERIATFDNHGTLWAEHIGLRPIAAFGNSDGDVQSLRPQSLPSANSKKRSMPPQRRVGSSWI